MKKRLLVATLFVCTAVVSYAVSGQNGPAPQMVLSIKVYEASDDGAEKKILAEPAIASISGRPFSFVSGGHHKTKAGEDDLEIGTRITGTFTRTGADTVQLVLDIRIGSAVSQKHEPKTDLVRTETIEIRTSLRPGQTKRLDCSRSQWCELTIDPVK